MRSAEAFRPTLGRNRWLFLVLAFAAAGPIAALLGNSATGLPQRIEIALVLSASTLSPATGLLALAALAPLGDMLAPVLGRTLVPGPEPVVLAFLTVWFAATATTVDDLIPLPARLGAAVWLFSSIVLASVASTAYELYRVSPGAFHEAIRGLTTSFLFSSDLIGARTASNLLEAVAVMVAAATLSRRHRWLPAALMTTLVAAGVAGAIGSVLLARGIGPADTLARQIRVGLPRYAATAGDVNAVASSYVLELGLAAGLALAASARRRVAYIAASGLLLVGIWLTGSRAAIGAVVVLLCLFAVVRKRITSRPVMHAAAIVMVVAFVGGVACGVSQGAIASADMRAGFTTASLRLIAARPVFGVGIGRYYPLSEMVLPPSLGWYYGRENAHDYYLQLTAELGVVGIVCFLWMLAEAMKDPVKRLWRASEQPATAGLVLGAIAYLVTAITGHPFLVLQAAVPFWIAAGLSASRGPSPEPLGHRGWWIVAACAALTIATAPFRPGVATVRLRSDAEGFETVADGGSRRFRDFASVYVSPESTGVELALRAVQPAESAGIGISVPGWSERHVVVERRGWSHVFITLPGAGPLVPRQRINLEVDPVPGFPRGTVAADLGEVRIVWVK